MNGRERLVEIRDLSVRMNRQVLVDHVGFSLYRGEIVTIIGPNGGGKTTLLRALIGTVPHNGTVIRKPGLVIGYTPQRLEIDRSMPVTAGRFLALSGVRDAGKTQAILDRIGITALRDTFLSDLSGGEIQRVLLARALLREPDLLILDEPTQGLDEPGEEHFYGLLDEIRRESGIGVLMVSHDLHVVMAGSDRVICLNGHVCCSGAPETVSTDPSYLQLFGRRAATALYQHHHDHSHEGHSHHG